MSGVKNWLMEMQEYSWHLIDEMAERNMTLDQAREDFVAKYGQSQVTVLNDMIAENDDFYLFLLIYLWAGGDVS